MSTSSANHNPVPTVGIVSPGEMGVGLAQLLIENGVDVVGTTNGRSLRTQDLSAQSDLRILNHVSEVISSADIVVSTVPPQAAVETAQHIAEQYSHLRAAGRTRGLTLVDANSVAPHIATQIQAIAVSHSIEFIDATVHGIASRLATQGTLFVSGQDGHKLCELFGDSLRTVSLGQQPGSASLMKMLLGGMSKGMIGLFLQSALLAEQSGLTESFTAELQNYYPDVASFVSRSLPTYRTHSIRRAAEMRQLVATLEHSDVNPGMASAAAALFESLSSCLSNAADVPHTNHVNNLIQFLSGTQNSHPTSEAAVLS